MNAPSPALVAPRPERLRLVGQRRQMLAVMHQRLMFGMLVYAGIIALVALRILYLAAFGDHAGRKEGLTSLIPDRGDIVDRDGEPLARTIDSRVQQALEHELLDALTTFSAIGAAGVVMDVRTGELLAMTSLPEINPNAPGAAPPEARFNRATQGVYELGSTFKPFTVAMAM